MRLICCNNVQTGAVFLGGQASGRPPLRCTTPAERQYHHESLDASSGKCSTTSRSHVSRFVSVNGHSLRGSFSSSTTCTPGSQVSARRRSNGATRQRVPSS